MHGDTPPIHGRIAVIIMSKAESDVCRHVIQYPSCRCGSLINDNIKRSGRIADIHGHINLRHARIIGRVGVVTGLMPKPTRLPGPVVVKSSNVHARPVAGFVAQVKV